MANIIVIIVVAIIIVNANRNAKKRHGQERAYYEANRTQPTMPIQRSTPGTSGRMAGTSGSYAGNIATGSTMQKQPVSKPVVKKEEKPDERKVSTTDYLENKAKQDQREHARERLEQQRRVNAKYGNLSMAGRYLLGDPVPVGCQIVCCDYCGAENIVKIGYHSGLSCYFCRNHLEN